jgi:hypothetical protein
MGKLRENEEIVYPPLRASAKNRDIQITSQLGSLFVRTFLMASARR